MSLLPDHSPLVLAQVESQPPTSDATQQGDWVGGTLGFGIVGFLVLFVIIKSCLRICNPNEILIVSGRKHRNPKGELVGYRVLFGGRTLTIPVIETVKRMDVTTMPCP
nr:hypothetical protein [Synechococcus elongatus]